MNDLYFIPILMQAFKREDRQWAIMDALKEITRLGALPEYATGYEQFEHFVTAGLGAVSQDPERASELIDIVINNILFSLATDLFEGPDNIKIKLLQTIQRHPELKSRYESICKETSRMTGEIPLEFELEKDNELIQSVIFPEESREVRITGVNPGQYSLRLANGRLLWEGRVLPKDVLWEEAFPGINYPMAADTGGLQRRSTRIEALFDGEVILTFYAGLEAGVMAISVQKKATE